RPARPAAPAGRGGGPRAGRPAGRRWGAGPPGPGRPGSRLRSQKSPRGDWEGSGGGEGEADVVPAEAERVVQRRHRRAAVRLEVPRLGGDVDTRLVVGGVEGDG